MSTHNELPFSFQVLEKDAPQKDIDAATDIFVKLHAEDKSTYYCIGGQMNLLPDVFRSHIKAALAGGIVYVAKHVSDGIVGLVAWFGPGTELLGTPEQAEAGFAELMADMGAKDPDMPIWWTQSYLPKYGEFTKKAFGDPQYKRNGWTLSMLGVKPEYQRRGIATEFVRLGEEKARREPDVKARHMAVDTETDEALAFYLKAGFVEKGRSDIESEKKFNGSFRQVCLAKELSVQD